MDSNSREERNWNDLPAEIKLVCIEWMDFKTRMSLLKTSRTEEELVEKSTKVSIDTASLIDGRLLQVKAGREWFIVDWNHNRKTIEWIIKKATIGQLRFLPMVDEILEIGMEFPIHAKTLMLGGCSQCDSAILEKCTGLETVEIHFRRDEIVKFSDLKDVHEVLYKLKIVRLSNLHSMKPDELIEWIQKWIELDKEPVSFLGLNFWSEMLNFDVFKEKLRATFGSDSSISIGDTTYIIVNCDSRNFRFHCLDERVIYERLE